MHNKELQTKDDYLSDEEVRTALEELTIADMIRLSMIIKKFEGRGFSTDDLVQEALVRILDGTRKWKRGMQMFPFLYSTMSSIADSNFKRKSTENAIKFSKDQLTEDKISKIHGESSPSPESLMIDNEADEVNAQRLQELFDLFKDDKDATLILMGEADGLVPEEIRKIGNMDKTRYDSTRKRIRRTTDRKFLK